MEQAGELIHARVKWFGLIHVLLQEHIHVRMQSDGLIQEGVAAWNVSADTDQVVVALIVRIHVFEALHHLEMLRTDQVVHRTTDGSLDVDGGVVA